MKFEKLNENKIRVTLTIQDLVEKEIDFHIFMSNPIESQHILLDMLEEAKKETGFDPEDSNLKVEALSMADTSFVFTITKLPAEEKQKSQRKKFTVKRKSMVPLPLNAVYCFNSFDDFCDILNSDCFYNEEYKILFDSLEDIELALLGKFIFFEEIEMSRFNFLNEIFKERQYDYIWQESYIEYMKNQVINKINNIQNYIMSL